MFPSHLLLEDCRTAGCKLQPLHAAISPVANPLDEASALESVTQLHDRGWTDTELLGQLTTTELTAALDDVQS